MSDYSSYYKLGYAYSQLGADPAGPNRIYNCVEASFEECFAALGYAWMHPQRLTDLVYGVGHHGGSDFTFVRDKILALGLYPGAPVIEVSNPDDTIGALRAALTAGYPVIIEFKDDLNAQLVPQWHANWHGTHASPVVAIGDKTVSILNVWDGSIQTFPHDTMRQATLSPAGNMVVFKRSLIPAVKLLEVDELLLLRDTGDKGLDGNAKIYAVDASGKRHLGGVEYAAHLAAGAKEIPMATADLALIPDADKAPVIAIPAGTSFTVAVK